jgi:hypothetical protein
MGLGRDPTIGLQLGLSVWIVRLVGFIEFVGSIELTGFFGAIWSVWFVSKFLI